MKALQFCRNMVASFATFGKVILLSRRPFKPQKQTADRSLIILGNGPSLRQAIDGDIKRIMQSDRLAVNFAANAPDYMSLKPQYYVLADSHFFTGADKDDNVKKLWENLSRTQWRMTLFVPHRYRKKAQQMLEGSDLIIKCFNLTPGEGIPLVSRIFYDLGWAMPRPRNVLIPSIMIGMRLGYKDIILLGADHSWSKSLWVDDENRVISVQPHFYKDGSKEQERVNNEYAGYHLHDILRSLYIAFRSYHQIQNYALKRGVDINNATPGSMIDAFKRITL